MDRQVAGQVDFLLAHAMADGVVYARHYGVMETENNTFFSYVVRLRKGEEVTMEEVTNGPFQEKYFKECAKIGNQTSI